MSAPTAPTLATLVAEALKKAGQISPDAALTTRAEDLWINEIKNDIYNKVFPISSGRMRSLQTTGVTVLTEGKSRYALPTDFAGVISVEILDGSTTGTAQAGAAGSITLASTNSATDIVGHQILVTSGTGVGSMSEITAFVSATQVATVTPNFTTAPTIGSTYSIIDTITPLDEVSTSVIKKAEIKRDVPDRFAIDGDADDGELLLYPTPYGTDSNIWGCRITYYSDINELDLAGTLMATLYKKWRNVWLWGVTYRALYELNDTNSKRVEDMYNEALLNMVSHETSGVENTHNVRSQEGVYY